MKTKKLLMMCLLVVAVICACTVRVNALEEYQESTATIFDEGGDYSLYYILNNFNHFVRTDVDAGHTIGAVAVGGIANYDRSNGKQGYTQTTSSYLEGPIKKVTANGSFKKLYVGETQLGNAIEFQDQNKQSTFISKGDCYINFDEAFTSIKKEASSFIGTGDYKITLADFNSISNPNDEVGNEHWKLSRINEDGQSKVILMVDAGYSYEFEDGILGSINRVEAKYVSETETIDGISNQEIMLISKDSGRIQIPYVRTLINGKDVAIANTSEWGDGTSFVYMLPNATEVTTNILQQHIGHIVAPDAYLHEMGGNINGCFVVNKLQVLSNSNGGASESHMFPYHGHRIKSNSSQPSKPSNPAQPGNSQDGNEKPGENNPGTGSGETPNNPSQGDTGDNNPDTGNDDASNNPQPGNATSTNPQPGQNNDNNENSNTGTETPDPKSNNDTNNSSTNNEIISNKEELTTNISRTQNTPKISSNKNSKVIVENNKQTNAKQKDSVKTGDNTHLLMYVLFELLAFVGIVSLRKKA